MIDPNHHPRCATQVDNLRCSCEREQAWDAERQRQRDHEFTTEKICERELVQDLELTR